MRGRLLVLLASISFGLFMTLAPRDGGKGDRVAKPDGGMVHVVVLTEGVPRGSVLLPAMVRRVAVPAGLVLPGAVDNAQALSGRIALVPLLAGEQVVESKLVPKDKSFGLSVLVPPGYRAFTIELRVPDEGALLNPGDSVDVLATLGERGVRQRSVPVAQGVRVLAVGGSLERDASQSPVEAKTITLALPLAVAGRVALAREAGALSLALHPVLPEGAGEGAGNAGECSMGQLAPGAFKSDDPPPVPSAGAVRARPEAQGTDGFVVVMRGSVRRLEAVGGGGSHGR